MTLNNIRARQLKRRKEAWNSLTQPEKDLMTEGKKEGLTWGIPIIQELEAVGTTLWDQIQVVRRV